MSSPGGKRPWLLRLAKLYILSKLGAGKMMNWRGFDNRELLDTATWLWWTQDYKFATRAMEELALRITEEHPPDGEKLESTFEEVPEKAEAAAERIYYCYCEGAEINYLCDCHVAKRGES